MRAAMRQLAAILLLALIPAMAAAFFHPRKPAWTSGEVTLSAARSWGKKVLWVDARAGADYERAHLPGAVPLAEETWDAQLPAMLEAWDADKIVVVYCSSLSCQASRDVARRLREEVGLGNVFALKGGWEAWQRAEK